jgi:membrane protein implicated in regulation of membrane protease activity
VSRRSELFGLTLAGAIGVLVATLLLGAGLLVLLTALFGVGAFAAVSCLHRAVGRRTRRQQLPTSSQGPASTDGPRLPITDRRDAPPPRR